MDTANPQAALVALEATIAQFARLEAAGDHGAALEVALKLDPCERALALHELVAARARVAQLTAGARGVARMPRATPATARR